MRMGDRDGVVLRVLVLTIESEGDDSKEYIEDPLETFETDREWPEWPWLWVKGISNSEGSKVKLGGVAGLHGNVKSN